MWNWCSLPQGASNEERLRGRLKLVLLSAPFGSLSNDDGNENGKKTKQQNNNLARASHFFVHSFAVVARLRSEIS